MKQNWNLAIKNKKPNGLYNVSVRCYENGTERYLDTEFQATKEDWNRLKEIEQKREVSRSPVPVPLVLKELDQIKTRLRMKVKETLDAITVADQTPTFELFKAVWKGRSLTAERSWITLLDKHLEIRTEYTLGTRRIYNDTRTLLKRMEERGFDLSLGNFKTEDDYMRLEKWFMKVGDIGKTSLSMHMQNIKAIAKTGYDPKKGLQWIKTSAFRDYMKPARKVGTHPNTLDDLDAIRTFDVSTIAANETHAKAYSFGRDFWCWMVLCGGMEARSIANLRWNTVHKTYFTFERAKIENSVGGGAEVVISTNTEMTQYMFERYSVKDNPDGYVFPFLTKDMTPVQKEIAITKLAKRITKNVQRIAKHLNITPLPSCKRTRPTFAVLSNEMGLDIKEQQQLMGHKKISTTEIYMTHLPTKTKISVSEKFALAMRGKKEEQPAQAAE